VMDDLTAKKKRKRNAGLKLHHDDEQDDDSDNSNEDSNDDDSNHSQNDIESALEMQMKQFVGQNGVLNVEEGSHIFASSLNSSLIDVYKNAQCVILLVNILKRKSWKYARKQLAKVPQGLDVVIMPNYMDRHEERVVSRNEIQEWCAQKSAQRGQTIRIIETSMKNCYGLKSLYTYFNIPFCKLKVDTVQKELKRLKEELKENRSQVDTTLQASDYNQHLKWLREGNAPENAVPFSEEIVARRSGADVRSRTGSVRGRTVRAKQPSPSGGTSSKHIGSASQKRPAPQLSSPSGPVPGTEGIPEHILRKYNLAPEGGSGNTDGQLNFQPSKKEIKSVNEFKIEGDIENFWGDDSDASDSDSQSNTESTFADTAITSQRTMTQADGSSSEDGFGERPVLTPEEDIHVDNSKNSRSNRKDKSSSRHHHKKKKRSSKRQRRKADTPSISEENKTERTEDSDDDSGARELDEIKDHTRKASMASSIGQLQETKSPITPTSDSLAVSSDDDISSDDEEELRKKRQRDDERKKEQLIEADARKQQEEKNRIQLEAEKARQEEEQTKQEELKQQQEEERKHQEALIKQQEKERQAQESLKEFSIAPVSEDPGAFFGDSSDEDDEKDKAPKNKDESSDEDNEEMGYIERSEVKDESSDEDESSDDDRSSRRKRRNGKKQPAKNSGASTTIVSTSTAAKSHATNLPPEVLKAIQEAEAQLKQNVETQEQKRKHRLSKRSSKEKDDGAEKKRKHRSSRRHKRKSGEEPAAEETGAGKKKGRNRSDRREKKERHRREKSTSTEEDED